MDGAAVEGPISTCAKQREAALVCIEGDRCKHLATRACFAMIEHCLDQERIVRGARDDTRERFFPPDDTAQLRALPPELDCVVGLEYVNCGELPDDVAGMPLRLRGQLCSCVLRCERDQRAIVLFAPIWAMTRHGANERTRPRSLPAATS